MRGTGEKEVRDALTAAFDVCHGCRACTELCDVFPTLFGLLDAQAEPDPGRLTPVEQDDIVDACVLCRRCVVACPYAPGRHGGGSVDIPRRMLDATAMRYRTGQLGRRRRRWAWVVGRPGWFRRLAAVAGPPASRRRRWVAAATGVSVTRPLSAATTARAEAAVARSEDESAGRAVVVLPTCRADDARDVAGDLADLLAVAGVCGRGECCGAPSLYAGDTRRFERLATANVDRLAPLAADHDLVVTHPTCATVIRDEYPRCLESDAAATVAQCVVSPARAVLDRTGQGERAPERSAGQVVLHVSGHAQWFDPDLPMAALLERHGFDVSVVLETDGTESLGQLSAHFDAPARRHERRWSGRVADVLSPGAVLASDGTVVRLAPDGEMSERPQHPIRIVADAWRATRPD